MKNCNNCKCTEKIWKELFLIWNTVYERRSPDAVIHNHPKIVFDDILKALADKAGIAYDPKVYGIKEL